MKILRQAILDFSEKKSANGFSIYNAECRDNKLAKHTLNINVLNNKLNKDINKNFVSTQNYYNEVLDSCYKINNAYLDVSIPVLYPTAEWTDGVPSEDATKTTIKLTPKRVVATMTISKSFLHYYPNNDVEFINGITEMVYDAILKQMFSTKEESEVAPKGIFNGLTPYTITSVGDLANLMSNTECGNKRSICDKSISRTKVVINEPKFI